MNRKLSLLQQNSGLISVVNQQEDSDGMTTSRIAENAYDPSIPVNSYSQIPLLGHQPSELAIIKEKSIERDLMGSFRNT